MSDKVITKANDKRISRLKEMKKYLIALFAVLAFFAVKQNTAHAYDTYNADQYIKVNDARINADGDLQVSWNRLCAGLTCANLPRPNSDCSGTGHTWIYLTVNGTSTPTSYGGAVISPGFPLTNDATYPSASYAPNGNEATTSVVYDVQAGMNVPASSIIATTPSKTIYANMVQVYRIANPSCATDNFAYLAPSTPYYTFLVNANEIPFTWTYTTPASGSVIGNFPNWLGNINYTGTGNPTTTVSISVGPSTSTQSVAATGTFYLTTGNNPISLANFSQFISPQDTTSSNWIYQATVDSSGTSITFPFTPFTASPTGSGGTCDTVSNVSLSTPFPSSTITNDFTNWRIATPQLLEGCSYTLQVSYSPNGIGSITQHTDQININVTPDYNPSTVSIPKTVNIWNYYNATTTRINYIVQLLNNDDGITLGNDLGQFYLGYSSTSSPLTAPAGFNSTLPCGGVCNNFGTVGSGIGSGSIGTPTSTIANGGAHCSPAADWTDIGGGISYAFCSTINWLFVPNETTKGILAGDMNALQAVPPFSWFFATNNAIMNGANDTAHLTPNLGITFEITGSSVIPTSSLTILPANLASMNVAGGKWSEFMNVWFNFLLTAIIILCIIMMYKVAL